VLAGVAIHCLSDREIGVWGEATVLSGIPEGASPDRLHRVTSSSHREPIYYFEIVSKSRVQHEMIALYVAALKQCQYCGHTKFLRCQGDQYDEVAAGPVGQNGQCAAPWVRVEGEDQPLSPTPITKALQRVDRVQSIKPTAAILTGNRQALDAEAPKARQPSRSNSAA
jgi:AhpD family alkylhydroperoxidase